MKKIEVNNNKHKAEKYIKILFSFFLLLITIAFILLLLKAASLRFIADDFCMGDSLLNRGFLGSQIWWFQNWIGRYSFTFLVHILVYPGSKWAGAATVSMFLIYLLSLSVTIYILFRKKLKKEKSLSIITALVISTLTLIFAIYMAPDPKESFFWLSGTLTYFAPINLFISQVAIIIYVLNYKNHLINKTFMYLLIFILSFIMAGFSEPYSMIAISFNALLMVYLLIKNVQTSLVKIILTSTVGVAIGTAIMIIAPGNNVRRSAFPVPNSFIDKAEQSILLTSDFFTRFIIGQKLAVIIIFSLGGIIAILLNIKIKNRSLGVLLFSLFTYYVAFLSFFPSIYLQSSNPPLRAYLLSTFVLIFFILFVGYMVINFLLSKTETWLSNVLSSIIIASFAISLGLWLFPKIDILQKQYVLQYRLSNEIDKRENYLIKSAGLSVKVQKLTNDDEIAPEGWLAEKNKTYLMQRYWKNECIKSYYRLKNFNFY